MAGRRSLVVRRMCALIVLSALLAACRPPAPVPMVSPIPAAARESSSAAATRAPEPTKAPAAAPRPAAVAPTVAVERPAEKVVEIFRTDGAVVSPAEAGQRKIIKNGEMNLLVADTDRAIDQVTSIAVDSGGYIISSQTALRGDLKFATLTLGVPVEQFEAVQRQLRSIALKVLSETASGRDVTDEYVDLQSRLTNLEATAARVREFLKQAQTVEEALKVNAQLTEIEGQINQVKGRMNYLRERSAFSTLLVNLEPERPPATPTPTPTPTATSTPTATPTPIVWQPDRTFAAATGTLSRILIAVGDLLIWLVVLGGPLLVIAALVAVLWLRRRNRPRG